MDSEFCSRFLGLDVSFREGGENAIMGLGSGGK